MSRERREAWSPARGKGILPFVGLWSLLALAACGDDLSIRFGTSFGTIVDDARCDGDGGFSLREEEGLIVIVIVDDETRIFVSGNFPAGCDDLTAGTEASVRGPERDGRIVADEIEIFG